MMNRLSTASLGRSQKQAPWQSRSDDFIHFGRRFNGTALVLPTVRSSVMAHHLCALQRNLVSPAPRSALVLGKAVSAGVRALSQALIVYLLALLLGVAISLDPVHIVGVIIAIMLASALFSTLSLIIACIVKTRERFMGIGQVLTMPLFFASNAIYPISLMPAWLRVISHGNPLTYEVDALRGLMLADGTTLYGLPTDYGILLGIATVLVMVGARLYPKVV